MEGCQALVLDPDDPLKSWGDVGVTGVKIIFDPASSIDRTVDEDTIPLYNNVDQNRESNIYQDVDYADFGSGSLNPINLSQIIEGTAKRASIQDSNYSIDSWTNSRYKGVKNSSPGFNIPYKAN